MTDEVPSLLGGNAERKSQLGGQDLLGGSEHLLFPSGQAAFAVPLRKVFDDHAARLATFKSNVTLAAVVVGLSALLNVAVFILKAVR